MIRSAALRPTFVLAFGMRIYLSRWVCRDVTSNLRRLEEESAAAAASGARLALFPESFLHGYTRRIDPAQVREAFARASAAWPEVAFFFGSFSESRRNRMTVWEGGRERASYDKVHLFTPNGEHELWEEGDRYVALRVAGHTVGLVNCNDLRFPEQARALRLQGGCDTLVVVAWWPWRRDHVWRALLRARAIENAVWTVGCCVAASEFEGEAFAGAGNHVFDPHGEPVRTLDDHTYELDEARAVGTVVDPAEGYRAVERVEVAGATNDLA
jgi:predicted amidohydrolase